MLQRAAKLHRRKGGGSLTMLLVLPGLPARGEPSGARARVLTLDPNANPYSHLSSVQREKLAAALAARGGAEGAAGGGDAQPSGCVRTEVRPWSRCVGWPLITRAASWLTRDLQA